MGAQLSSIDIDETTKFSFSHKKMELAFFIFSLSLCLLTNSSPSGYHKKARQDLTSFKEEVKKMRKADQIRLAEVERKRRADAGVVAELKKLIHSQLEAYHNEHTTCAMGTHVAESSKEGGFTQTKTIQFGQKFDSAPKVIASVAAFRRNAGQTDRNWGLAAKASNATTSSFQLFLEGYDTKISSLTAVWIACE